MITKLDLLIYIGTANLLLCWLILMVILQRFNELLKMGGK